MPQNSKFYFLSFFLVAAFFSNPVSASAEPEFVLKIATVAPARTPWADLLKRYAKKVKKASEGRIKVKVYLGGVKGDELSIMRQVRKGKEIQLGGVSTGAAASLVPDIDVLELPYLFATEEEADRILDGPARPVIERMLEAKGFKLIMYSENGYRSFGTKGNPVLNPGDLKAKKMRCQETPVHLEMYRALGASPVTISVGEVMSALQTGVVHGFDNTPLFTQAVSWHQAIDHFTVTEHIYQPALVIANKKWFDSLPPEMQKVLTDPINKLENKGRKAVRALKGPLLDNLSAQGVQVHRLSPEQKAAFQKITRPVWDKKRKAATKEGKELLDIILKAKANK